MTLNPLHRNKKDKAPARPTKDAPALKPGQRPQTPAPMLKPGQAPLRPATPAPATKPGQAPFAQGAKPATPAGKPAIGGARAWKKKPSGPASGAPIGAQRAAPKKKDAPPSDDKGKDPIKTVAKAPSKKLESAAKGDEAAQQEVVKPLDKAPAAEKPDEMPVPQSLHESESASESYSESESESGEPEMSPAMIAHANKRAREDATLQVKRQKQLAKRAESGARAEVKRKEAHARAEQRRDEHAKGPAGEAKRERQRERSEKAARNVAREQRRNAGKPVDSYGNPIQGGGAGYTNYDVAVDGVSADEKVTSTEQDSVQTSTVYTTDHNLHAQSAHDDEIGAAMPLNPGAEAQSRAEESKDGSVAAMQKSLRDNNDNRVDVPDSDGAINRNALSPNEAKSQGWALIGMRDKYLKDDHDAQTGWNVTYAKNTAAKLDSEADALLAMKSVQNRQSLLCTMKGGKMVHHNGQGLDTSSAQILAQELHERQTSLQTKLDEAKQKGVPADKLAKLEQKLAISKSKPQQDSKIGGKFIYVMNAKGQFFACEAQKGKQHHSTMLAAGAVACAGELKVENGVIQLISNISGHYRPGPAYLWQAVQQLKMSGAPMNFQVQCAGVPKKFQSGDAFLAAMDPSKDKNLFDTYSAVAHLRAMFV